MPLSNNAAFPLTPIPSPAGGEGNDVRACGAEIGWGTGDPSQKRATASSRP